MAMPKKKPDEMFERGFQEGLKAAETTALVPFKENLPLAPPTKESYDDWRKEMLVRDAPEFYDKLKLSILKSMEPMVDADGKVTKMPSVKAMELAARILGVDPGTGGVNIIQQFNNSGNQVVINKGGLEDLVRRSDARSRNQAEVIDAEIIEEK